MRYEYTHLIPENIAPKGATRIVVKRESKEVCSIPASRFGGMAQPPKNKILSVGIFSDAHMGYNSYTNKSDPTTVGTNFNDGNGNMPNGTYLREALTYMSGKVAFCCCAGDFTNIGFYFDKGDTTLYPYQFQEYRDICDLFPDMPVYNIVGNHENYNANIPSVTLYEDATLPDGKTFSVGTPLTTLWEYYTGHGLNYTIERNGVVFVFVSQSINSHPMSEDTFNWLSTTLGSNKDKRCIVFVHSFIDESWASSPTEVADVIKDSGNPCNARGNSLFGYWGAYNTNRFMTLMRQYTNTILFHGHSHTKFESQEYDKEANYTDRNGFKSVHIPSLGDPRTLTGANGSWKADNQDGDGVDGGQFYIMDVYDDCIVLNGMYVYKENKDSTTLKVAPIPLGTYKIDV